MAKPKEADRPVCGHRLRVARQYRGFTRRRLAQVAGVAAARLSSFETGRASPTTQELRILAEALGMYPTFFSLPLRTEVDEEGAHFRDRSASHREKASALGQATLVGELLEFFRTHLTIPTCTAPQLAHLQPAAAAAGCRRAWGYSVEKPLANIVRVVEQAGIVVVYGDPTIIGRVDAFSTWLHDGGALVVLNPEDPPSRNAFNIAHEVGHLVLHHEKEAGNASTEEQADIFASAFLMPEAGFIAEWAEHEHPTSWGALFQMKARWLVSVQAVIHRARDLSLISNESYRSLCIRLSKNGWRTREPEEFVWPEAEFLNRCFSSMSKYHSMDPHDVATTLGLHPESLARLCGSGELPRAIVPSNVVSLAGRRGA